MTDFLRANPENLRSRLESLRAELDNERSSFRPHWRDLSEVILPRRSRFVVTDSNRGERRHNKIVDNTATLAARTLRSGMMSGITSPARPWFKLATPDLALNEQGDIKQWLEEVERRMRSVFLRSNLYNTLPIVYGDLGTFGTASLYVEEDFDDVIRTFTFPIGSYKIANDEKLRVRVFMREFRMTVRQIVEEFGRPFDGPDIDWSNITQHVKDLWEQGLKETWIHITHVIMPNEDYDPNRGGARFKRYASIYFEDGSGAGTQGNQHRNALTLEPNKFLRRAGFDDFPVLVPRWEVAGEDVYGTSCPGMEALGDIKQLQLGEKRGMQAIEKMVNPPMIAPTQLRTVRTSILPGDITYADEREGQKGFRPAHEINPQIRELELKQEQVRNRIRRAFFEDLFLLIANDQRRQPVTAREIEERHEEKLLALGPVLEQLNQDLLDPLIDITFNIMQRQGILPPPPKDLEGIDLRVEYISIMAQAQKLVGVGNIERFTQFAGAVIQQSPETQDKVDSDQLLDVYADLTSIPAGVVRSDDDVAAIRAQRQQAQAIAQATQNAQAAAGAAKDLSQASLEEDSALKRIVDSPATGQTELGA